MNLPRLLTSDGKGIQRIINPMHVSLSLNIVPLSYASIRLSKDEYLPARGLVELFTPYGSAGVYRVRSPQDAYGDEITTAELEHSIAEVGDYLVKEKLEEMIPADSAMRRVFSYYKGNLWKLGTVSALGSGAIALSLNYERVLDAMISILGQKKNCMMAFDFSTTPWTVNIVSKGTEVEAEGRLSRNVTSAKVSYDDTEMCTRVYYEVVDSDGNSHWESRNADNISSVGVIEREISLSSGLTTAEINTIVNTYLNEHKKPRVGVSILGNDLSVITGESLDKFSIGKKFRLVIPEYNVVLEDIIVGLSWDDLYRMPTSVFVNIGDLEDTIVTYIHNLDVSGSSGGGGGGGGKKKTDDQWREYIADFYKTDKTVGLYAKKVDHANEVLEKAGIDVNSQGVLIYAETKDGLGAHFNVLSKAINAEVEERRGETEGLRSTLDVAVGKISLVVDDKSGEIKSASIVASIDKYRKQSQVKISADIIDLDGIVKLLKSRDIDTASITAGRLIGNEIDVYNSIQVGTGGGLTTITQGGIWCSGLYHNDRGEYQVLNATKSGNTLSIYKTDGTRLDFSKAVTEMKGVWGNGVLTVTPQPQGTPTYKSILSTGSKSLSGKTYTVPINAAHGSSGQYSDGQVWSVTVNASDVYDDGYDDGYKVTSSQVSGSISGTVPKSAGSSAISGRRNLGTVTRPSVASYLLCTVNVHGASIDCYMTLN